MNQAHKLIISVIVTLIALVGIVFIPYLLGAAVFPEHAAELILVWFEGLGTILLGAALVGIAFSALGHLFLFVHRTLWGDE